MPGNGEDRRHEDRELVWSGKYNDDETLKEVPRVSLPFQIIETVNESPATREAKRGGVQPSCGLTGCLQGYAMVLRAWCKQHFPARSLSSGDAFLPGAASSIILRLKLPIIVTAHTRL